MYADGTGPVSLPNLGEALDQQWTSFGWYDDYGDGQNIESFLGIRTPLTLTHT